jgi:hypothetical protein
MKDIKTDNPSALPCWFDAKNTYLAAALIADGFEYVGLLEDIPTPDYLEVVMGNWSVGSICCTNSLIVICDGAVFSFDCDAESLLELRWNSTKKLIRHSLKTYTPTITHKQLELFAA